MKFDSPEIEFGSGSMQIRNFSAKFPVGPSFRTLDEFGRIWSEFWSQKTDPDGMTANLRRIWAYG